MKERSLTEVKAALAAEQRELDKAITNQSFFCSSKKHVVSPAQCHDCFAIMPYFEKLSRWKEDRMLCIKEHGQALRKPATCREEGGPGVTAVQGAGGKREQRHDPAGFSIEEYVSRSLLEYYLELDSLAEKFETWWLALAPEARSRIHKSTDLLEALMWFGERLREFQCTVVRVARCPDDDDKNNNMKEESCGVKN